MDRADSEATLQVRVIPRAGRTSLAGWRDGALVVRVTAAPVEGAANESLIHYLAELLRVPRRAIAIVGGGRSRDKRLRISGLSPDELNTRLGAFATQNPASPEP